MHTHTHWLKNSKIKVTRKVQRPKDMQILGVTLQSKQVNNILWNKCYLFVLFLLPSGQGKMGNILAIG